VHCDVMASEKIEYYQSLFSILFLLCCVIMYCNMSRKTVHTAASRICRTSFLFQRSFDVQAKEFFLSYLLTSEFGF
jgi:hypothetical protein